ncbi:MAG: hypothetical protein AAFZ87_12725 [Planctomycetota bacterium]
MSDEREKDRSMEEPRDDAWLDELRRAWRALPDEVPDAAAEDAGPEVARLRAAWEALEADAPRSELQEDELALLRRGWDALAEDAASPASAAPSEIDWMQRAWDRLGAADAPPLPHALARRARARSLWRRARRAGAAAAFLAAGALLGHLALREGPAPAESTTAGAAASTQPDPQPPSAPRPEAVPVPTLASVPRIVPVTEYAAAPLETYDTGPVTDRADGVEYVQGSVRVVLVAPRRDP